jgi:methionine-rich copper-binding protein CopC
MKRIVKLVSALALLMMTGVAAQAHAHLTQASPAVGSTVTAAPKVVTLSFSESLEPAFSSVAVTNANGVAMQAGKAALVPGTKTQLQVKLKPLKPGTYKVQWRVLSVDTHRTQGDFSFRVGP